MTQTGFNQSMFYISWCGKFWFYCQNVQKMWDLSKVGLSRILWWNICISKLGSHLRLPWELLNPSGPDTVPSGNYMCHTYRQVCLISLVKHYFLRILEPISFTEKHSCSNGSCTPIFLHACCLSRFTGKKLCNLEESECVFRRVVIFLWADILKRC